MITEIKGFLKLKFFLIFITIIFVSITSYFYHNKAFSLHFVDEETNFTFGKQLLSSDKLYSDISTNHQPLAFTLSAAVQKTTNPNSIFLLIKRHREFIILFSIVWSVFLVWRFGLPLLIFTVIFEQTKIFLLGNLFLAESLSVYPLVYLVGLVLLNQTQIKKIELAFIGFCISFIALMLAPIWPLLFLLFVMILISFNGHVKAVLWIIFGALPLLLLSLPFISIANYYEDVFLFNKYYVSVAKYEPFPGSIIQSFIAPLISFFINTSSNTLVLIRILSVGLIVGCLYALKRREYRLIIYSILILGFSNLRYFQPGKEYYQGFHLIFWFALLILITTILLVGIFRNVKSIWLRVATLSLILVIGVISFKGALTNLFIIRDVDNDLYINYSNQFTMGEAIKIMSSGNSQEDIFVIPDEWLIYWQSGLKTPAEINTYYEWMNDVPPLRQKLENLFNQNKPTYFYCDCDEKLKLNNYLSSYKVLRKDNNPTQLYVLPEKLETLTLEQKQKLEFYGFETENR